VSDLLTPHPSGGVKSRNYHRVQCGCRIRAVSLIVHRCEVSNIFGLAYRAFPTRSEPIPTILFRVSSRQSARRGRASLFSWQAPCRLQRAKLPLWSLDHVVSGLSDGASRRPVAERLLHASSYADRLSTTSRSGPTEFVVQPGRTWPAGRGSPIASAYGARLRAGSRALTRIFASSNGPALIIAFDRTCRCSLGIAPNPAARAAVPAC